MTLAIEETPTQRRYYQGMQKDWEAGGTDYGMMAKIVVVPLLPLEVLLQRDFWFRENSNIDVNSPLLETDELTKNSPQLDLLLKRVAVYKPDRTSVWERRDAMNPLRANNLWPITSNAAAVFMDSEKMIRWRNLLLQQAKLESERSATGTEEKIEFFPSVRRYGEAAEVWWGEGYEALIAKIVDLTMLIKGKKLLGTRIPANEHKFKTDPGMSREEVFRRVHEVTAAKVARDFPIDKAGQVYALGRAMIRFLDSGALDSKISGSLTRTEKIRCINEIFGSEQAYYGELERYQSGQLANELGM